MCVCAYQGPHIHRPVRVIHPPPDYLALVDQYAADGRFAGLERCFGLVGVSALSSWIAWHGMAWVGGGTICRACCMK